MDLTGAQLKKAWQHQEVICITAIEDGVRFVFAKGEADGQLVDRHGRRRCFASQHLAWKWIDTLKGNEPDPF
jgi:hypothetical protein